LLHTYESHRARRWLVRPHAHATHLDELSAGRDGQEPPPRPEQVDQMPQPGGLGDHGALAEWGIADLACHQIVDGLQASADWVTLAGHLSGVRGDAFMTFVGVNGVHRMSSSTKDGDS
jgi:hypothetical protein